MTETSACRMAHARVAFDWAFTAFGMTVRSELPVQGSLRNDPLGRASDVSITQASTEELREAWIDAAATCLLERSLPDGTLGMRVECRDGYGYRVHAPGHGEFFISVDGSLVRCAPADGPSWRWQRPFFAQVLPIAATLKGFELLHASAVVLNGAAVAFSGRSGAGKTSLAVHLASRGAYLLTDDVLSLKCRAGTVMAQPGVPMVNVASEQLESMSPTARDRLGTTVGTSDKVHIQPGCMPKASFPLTALYFVERGADVSHVTFESLDPPDPLRLLGATFLPHLLTTRKLVYQLETCAEIASSVRIYRLRAPKEVPAASLAEAVEHHAGSAGTSRRPLGVLRSRAAVIR